MKGSFTTLLQSSSLFHHALENDSRSKDWPFIIRFPYAVSDDWGCLEPFCPLLLAHLSCFLKKKKKNSFNTLWLNQRGLNCKPCSGSILNKGQQRPPQKQPYLRRVVPMVLQVVTEVQQFTFNPPSKTTGMWSESQCSCTEVKNFMTHTPFFPDSCHPRGSKDFTHKHQISGLLPSRRLLGPIPTKQSKHLLLHYGIL